MPNGPTGDIIAAAGWPTFDLVGTDGSTAAWVIAQHADFDPALQQQVVELLRPLVERQADAARTGLPRGSGRREPRSGPGLRHPDGCEAACPLLATPIVDEATVDERRAAVGLGPLADYYAGFEVAQLRSERSGGLSLSCSIASLDRGHRRDVEHRHARSL